MQMKFYDNLTHAKGQAKMKDIGSIVSGYISDNILCWFKARKKRRLPKVRMTYKKPRMRLSRILTDDTKETLAFFLGVVIVAALLSLALSPYLDEILSWV